MRDGGIKSQDLRPSEPARAKHPSPTASRKSYAAADASLRHTERPDDIFDASSGWPRIALHRAHFIFRLRYLFDHSAPSTLRSGGSRTLRVRTRWPRRADGSDDVTVDIPLPHNSLYVMLPPCQVGAGQGVRGQGIGCASSAVR